MARPAKYSHRKATKKMREKVVLRDGSRCRQCGKELNSSKPGELLGIDGGHFHHIFPLIYGGENNADNILLLCAKCHMAVHSGSERVEKYKQMKRRVNAGMSILE